MVAVVDAQVVEIVSGDSLLLEVERVRGVDMQTNPVPIDGPVEVAAFFDEYELDGNELTFFLNAGGISEYSWGISYVHDRSTDEPVAGFPDEGFRYGATLDEMLDCLVAEHGVGSADHPRLEALVLETTRESELEDLCVRQPGSE